MQDENRRLGLRPLHALNESASAPAVNLADEDLDRSCEWTLPTDLEAELIGHAGERMELGRIGGDCIPAVGMAGSDLDRLASAPADDDGGGSIPIGPRRGVVDVERFVRDTLPPPQRRKNLTEAR